MARILLFSVVIGKLAAVACWILEPWSLMGAVLFFVPDLAVLYQLFTPSSQWLCRVFTHFATDDREVWLTIDDGPDREDTPRILDLLEQHNARATFFVLGERVARWPNLVGLIMQRGHEIGHHTHTHPVGSFWCASQTRVRRELDDATAVLFSAGARPTRFRPPVGIKNVFLGSELKSRGLHCVGWTIRSGDCLGRRADEVVSSVMRQVRPGSILLVHEGESVPQNLRVRVIAMLLESLTVQGYRCVLPRLDQLRSGVMAKHPAAVGPLPSPAIRTVGVAD